MKFNKDAPIQNLFDCLRDVVFFVKDSQGRYVTVNDTLVERCGAQRKSQLIGKTPPQVMGKTLGDVYSAQDKAVIETGQPILDQLELHIYTNHQVGWCLTNKRPVFDHGGAMTGLAGISQDLRSPNISHDDYEQLSSVIAYTATHLADPPTVKTLATVADLSAYQLDRRIRRTFGLSTGQWVLKQRLDSARRRLQQSDASIAEISVDAGYCDQSAFSRQFHRATGFTPSDWRRLRPSRVLSPTKS